MKVLSLFDGISCARVALERAGFRIEKYYASEVDKYAIQIAQKNYPDTIQLGDVNDVRYLMGTLYWDFMGLQGTKIDLMVGGFPCQDLSVAKKDRKGLEGSRSGLFWEMVRIHKEVNPRWWIYENVASMPKKDKEIISKTLGVEPIMINAALVSAQNRKRLFWTNIPNITQPDDRGILLKDILENGNTDRLKSYCIDANYFKGGNEKSYAKGKRQIIRIGSLNSGGQGDRIYSPEGKSVNLSANGGGRGAKTGLYAVALRNRGEGKKPELGGDKANSLTTVQTDFMVSEDYHIRKLTPIECERLQGLRDNYTEGISNTQRYKCLGNAFNVDVVAHILSFIPKSMI